MIVIGGEGAAAVQKAAVRQAYGLTPAEARLLAALVEGERLNGYARRTGISITTAKSHLNSLFDKVGERRQADLIRRAASDGWLRSSLGDASAGISHSVS
jgi:DNA-binding CsgD family transcriptional regulator